MNKRVKKLWLKALRSGKYKQGRRQLKTELSDGVVKHCCLGVLEELACQAGVITTFDPSAASLDNETQRWAGLESDDPIIGAKINGDTPTAATVNDAGRTFQTDRRSN